MWGEGTVLDVDVGPNLYAYVRQNPWSKFDPLGLEEKKDTTTPIVVKPPPKVAPAKPNFSFFFFKGLRTTSTVGILNQIENDPAVQRDLAVNSFGSERERLEHSIQKRLTFDFGEMFKTGLTKSAREEQEAARANYYQSQTSLDAKHWLLAEQEEFSPSLLPGIEKADKQSELWRMYKVTAAKDGNYHKYVKGDGKTDNGNPSHPYGQTLAKGEVWKYGITRDFSPDFHNRYPEGHLDFIAGGPVNIQQIGTPGSELRMRARERAAILNHNAIMGYDLPGNPVPW